MKRLADRLREDAGRPGAVPGAGAAAGAMDRASSSAGAAADAPGEEGAAARREAEKALEEARENLRDPRIAERQKELLKDPLRDQEKLAADARALAKDLAASGDGGGSSSASGAAESMDGAAGAMEEGDGETAEERQREAERRLRELKEELDRERTRYENIRQEELLFRIAKELAALVEGQSSVNLRVRDLDDKRAASGGELSRFDRLSLVEIQEAEKGLAAKAEFVASSIEKEDSPVYGFVLRSIAEDMGRLASELGDLETGPGVQVLGSEVLRRLQDLAEALKHRKEEMEAAQKGKPQDGGQQQNGEAKKPLVPPAAELRMLKSLQEEVNAGLDSLSGTLEAEGPLPEDAAREVDRLARRQSRLRDLWLALAKKFGLPTEDEGAAEGEGGEGR